MKYIVSSLKTYIINQAPQEASKTMLRIDGFEDVKIYDLFCKEISQYCEENNINLIAKLSYPKYLEFENSKSPNSAPSITSMKQNGWIDKDDSLTQYRNLLPKENEKLLVVMMGTEIIEDKGGIHDIYYVNSNRMESDMQGDYSSVFNMFKWSADEKTCINKLFKWLFSLVPINLYRLSCLADEWHDVDDIYMLIEYFFKSLPSWNLCKQEEQLPSMKEILNSDKNLLLTNYDFIERNKFKRMSHTQFKKYNSKIKEYSANSMTFSDNYSGWGNQSIKSYGEVLSGFILGQNIDELRAQLTGVDFAITQDVLNLKLDNPGRGTGTKTIKVYGSPLYAILWTINSAILTSKESASLTKIEFSFTKARLVNQIDTSGSSNENLLKVFKNICYHTGGIFDFISNGNLQFDGAAIDIIVTPQNFFTPNDSCEQVEEGRVSSLGITQELNKISFSLFLKDNNDSILDEIDYEWCF
uniref:hypothetical protein n=1 Tax=Alkalibaculum bacchi TaxID=645887 RepID=UPI0026EF378C